MKDAHNDLVSFGHTALDAVSSLASVLWMADQVRNDVVSFGHTELDAACSSFVGFRASTQPTVSRIALLLLPHLKWEAVNDESMIRSLGIINVAINLDVNVGYSTAYCL